MKRFALIALLATGACQAAPVRTVIYEQFAQLDESLDTEHYEQFVDMNGGLVSFGCFVVQKRQLNCFDNAGSGQPNIRKGVVECDCPCKEKVPDPCDSTRAMVRAGTVVGLVNETSGPLALGGIEWPTDIDLSGAQDLFITTEQNEDDSPAPSANVVLKGALIQDGTVSRGTLKSPSNKPVQGAVTIVPVKDEVSL